MLLLAHTGITLGIFNLCCKVFSRIASFKEKKVKEKVSPAKLPDSTTGDPDPPGKIQKLEVDFRLVILGSMFPDMVDKPVGMFIFANFIANGRIYTHTLLFNLILVTIGIYFLIKRKRVNFFIFGLSSCFHLLLDEMWLTPRTLFWPLYGWDFPREDISHWWENIFQVLCSNPRVYVPEIIGIIILLGIGIKLIKIGMVREFLSQGKIP